MSVTATTHEQWESVINLNSLLAECAPSDGLVLLAGGTALIASAFGLVALLAYFPVKHYSKVENAGELLLLASTLLFGFAAVASTLSDPGALALLDRHNIRTC